MSISRRNGRLATRSRFRSATRLMLVAALGLGGSITAVAQDDPATRYAQMLRDTRTMAAHNSLIERQIGSQQSEIQHLEAEIEKVDETAAGVPDLLQRMFVRFEQFVTADLPFLDPVADRKARVERLRELMTTEGTSQAERYRRLMEAYQIEVEYGRTMSDYTSTLPDGREAEFVHVGRIALLYLTQDGREAGYWDAERGEWVVDNRYLTIVNKALRMARKQLAPDVLAIPIPAAKEVDS